LVRTPTGSYQYRRNTVKSRIGKATGNSQNLKKFWTLSGVPCSLKAKIHHACVRSVLLYGSESWPVKQTDIQAINVFENKCARVFIDNGYQHTNIYIRERAKLGASIDPVIKERRLRWIGHVLRMELCEIPNAALEFVKGETWKRPAGGMKTTWRKIMLKDIEKHAKPRGVSWKTWDNNWFDICKNIAENRNDWRALVTKVLVAGDGSHGLR
jgi:hypothetical protein